MRIFTLARVVYHFSVPLLSALPTEASVEQGPAEGLERRLKPSSITEAAAGGASWRWRCGTLTKSLILLLEGIPCPLHHTWANPCPRGKAAAPPAAS